MTSSHLADGPKSSMTWPDFMRECANLSSQVWWLRIASLIRGVTGLLKTHSPFAWHPSLEERDDGRGVHRVGKWRSIPSAAGKPVFQISEAAARTS
jgi:hypothetical protein